MKRKDECIFCSSRSCYTRIVRDISPKYDEIACDKHITELKKHSDVTLGKDNKVMRWRLSVSHKVKRGEDAPSVVEDAVG